MATKFDAIPEVQFDAVPEIEFDAVPDQVSPDLVAQEAQRASTGALQALDVMAAPRQFDWADVNERLDTERFMEADALRKQASELLRTQTGSESEAYGLFRRADEVMEGSLSPTTAGKAFRERQERYQRGPIEPESRTPSELLSGFLGPGLSSTVQPVAESAARNIGPAAGGAAGAAMFLLPGGGALPLLSGLAGALGGSQVGGAVQEEILKTTESPEETEQRRQRAAEDFARNPWAARIGAMAASSPFFGPSLAQFGRAAVGDRGAITNLGIAGAIGGGIEMVNAAIQGRTANAEDIAAGVFSNMIMNEPTKLGRRLGFHPSSEQAAIEAAQKYAELPPEGLTSIGADLESGLSTRGTTSTADVFANVPRRQTEVPIPPEVAPDAQQDTQAGQIDGGVRAPEVTPENVPLPPAEGGEGVQPSRQREQLVEAAPEQAQPEVAAATDAPEIVGIRNSLTDLERHRLGQPARTTPEPRGFEQIRSEAQAVLANDSQAGARLVSELTQDIRPLNDTENALLTFELKIRRDALDNAYRAINEAQTPEQKTAAQAQMAFAQNEHFKALQIAENAGTENAQALNSRKLILNEDFSLGRMLAEKQAVENDGQPLTKQQTEEVTKLYDRIKELETKLQTAESTKAESTARKEYENILKETRNEAKTAAKEKKSFVDFLDAQAEKARQRIIARRGRLQVTIDPLNVAGLVDEAIIGASHVARGLRDFGQWSKKMVDEFGERIRPHLDALFQRANELEFENAKPFITKTPKTREEVLESAQKIDRATVFDLARFHINQGVDGFENVMNVVEQDLKAKFPDVTPRQIRDALSEYGKTSQPSKAEDLKKLREYRSISRLMSQLEDAQKGIQPKKTGMQRDKTTARVRELQKKVNEAMEEAGFSRTSEDQLASSLDAAKTRIRNATEDLQRKINRGDYSEKPKREQPVDQERINLEYDLAKVKQEYQKGLIEARRAKRSTGEKIWDTTKETFNLSRQLLTSGDLPPVFRQGLFAIGRPKMMAQALKDSLQAMVSEKKRFAIDREIQNRPNAPLYQRSKLYLAKDTGQPLSQQEEAYMGNWFKEINFQTGKNLPITPIGRAAVRGVSGVLGAFLRGSERSYNTFLNKLRADTFDAAIKAYDIAPTETAHLRALADVINTMTGRAKLPLKSLEQGAGALNTFLFAPRFFASRLKLATGQPLWSGTSKSRKFALEQYGRTLAGASLIYGLANMAGAKIETDPRSTDFLKIKIGNTRIDPLGGLIQITNFLTRVVTGETKTKEGVKPLRESLRPLQEIDKRLGTRMAAHGKVGRKDAGDTIWDFGRTKLNPIVGAAFDLTTGEDIVGRPTTVGGTLKKMSVPISFQDISETMQEQGVPKGTALWILSLFGAGLQTYGKR